MIIKGYRYRIYPTEEQIIQINKTFGCCRFVYNYFLANKIELYKNENKSLSFYECCKLLTNLKKESIWLQEVDKFTLQNSLKDLDSAYQNFFRRVKNGERETGFPKFKSRRDNTQSCRSSFNLTLKKYPNMKILFDENTISLPKLKNIKCKLHRKFDGKILSATLSKTPSGKYYVSFNVECEHEVLPKNNNSVGIDLGVKDLVITSDGEVINNNKTTYKYEKKLAKLQRQFAKKKKGSNNSKKHRVKVARLHEKITNIRKDILHQTSSKLIKENQLIFSEDLNVKGMVKNHNLAKSVHDCGWNELTRQLQYKAEWNGRVYHKVDRFFASSQLCSECGYKNTETKNLNVRFWICPECNNEHDRDINAAINILNQGLKDIV